MELTHFGILFKAQTHEDKISEYLEQIRLHHLRVESIEKQRQESQNLLGEKQELLDKSKAWIQSAEKDLHQLTQSLEKAKEHLANASTQKQVDSLESEINTLDPKAEELETKLLEEMEKVEFEEVEIEKCETFLKGSAETLEEIKLEVQKDVQKEEVEIKKLEEKVRGLLQEVPNNLKEAYLELNTKYLYKKPLSFAIDRQCHHCKFDIGGNTQGQVDSGRTLEFCPSCSRLLIPLAAKIS